MHGQKSGARSDQPLLEICINKRRSVNIVDINTGNITSFGLHVKTTHWHQQCVLKKCVSNEPSSETLIAKRWFTKGK